MESRSCAQCKTLTQVRFKCSPRVKAWRASMRSSSATLSRRHVLRGSTGILLKASCRLHSNINASHKRAVSSGDSVRPNKAKMLALKIFQRYHFSSQLKRMTVIAGYIEHGSTEAKHIVAVKGAPETLKSMASLLQFVMCVAYVRAFFSILRYRTTTIRPINDLRKREREFSRSAFASSERSAIRRYGRAPSNRLHNWRAHV